MTGGATESADAKLWRERMGDKGWGTPTWPKPYGGGLSRAQARVLQEEMAAIGARNPIGGMGVSMFGPTLLEYGTEEQKRRRHRENVVDVLGPLVSVHLDVALRLVRRDPKVVVPRGAVIGVDQQLRECAVVTRRFDPGNFLDAHHVLGGRRFVRHHSSPQPKFEHEPHLPALQFHRTARSGACCAWMR